ncbi:hypothetical protein XA68_11604 [Ophiocordyceps unilateralis]|uniref:Uncharacterized protein n=1 Tax=Ophiocordyceps unilateralis TaxID=268505 RepID=A0A2A9PGI8_OPHUN|nr:hypothetical protein XA68_11604 [Ophiocordyceps unilateralis]
MPSNVVAADIHDFLRKVERDRGSGLSYQSDNYANASYQYPPLLLSEPGTSARSVQAAASLASSATPRSLGFDSGDGQSVYSVSTAPPRQGPEPLHRQRADVPDFAPTWLPCEFRRLSRCNERFASDDVDTWIQHIVSEHLGGKLPAYCICWFCDQAEFRSGADKADNYRRRMLHIASHFRDEGKTTGEVRWDFHFLDHLRHHGLVSDSVFHWATQQSELPAPKGMILVGRQGARSGAGAEEEKGESRRRLARPRESSRPLHMRRFGPR